MRDYEGLVRKLREADEKSMCGECGMNLHSGTTKKGVLFAEAADAIEELMGRTKVLEKVADKWCEAVPKWIGVEKRLPKNGWWCLVWGSDWNIPIMAFCDGEKWTDAQFEHPKVTHWMPLPEPPKEDEDE